MISAPLKFVSRKLKFISNAWIAFPAIFLLYAVAVMQVDSAGFAKIILSPSYWFVSLVAAGAGLAMRRITWFAWHLFIFANFVAAYLVAVGLAYFSDAPYRLFIFLGTLLLQAMGAYVVGREIRVPYYSPRIRWWESDPRYRLSLKTEIERHDSTRDAERAEIADFSRGGCFIKTGARFAMDSTVTVRFTIFERTVECMGLVVWATEGSITHPKGIGVRFINLDRQTNRLLKEASVKLRDMAQTQTALIREKSWQEYMEREKQFQERRRGRHSS